MSRLMITFPMGLVTVMDERMKAVITHQLTSITGQLTEIEGLACEDEYYIDLLRRIQSVQTTLNKVCVIVLSTYLDSCVSSVVKGEDTADHERLFHEVASLFELSNKYKYSIEGDFHDNGNQDFYST